MSDMQASSGNLTDKAYSTMHDIQDAASNLTGELGRAAKDGAAKLGDTARQVGDTAMEKVDGVVSERRSMSADYISSIAQATEQAAQAFEKDLPQAANFIRQASDHIWNAADTVREGDAREMVRKVQDFARTQPTLFFGGAVILGFAALRFLKSSPPAAAPSYDARPEEHV